MSKSSARVLKGKGFWLAQAVQHTASVGSATVAPSGTVTVNVTAQGSSASQLRASAPGQLRSITRTAQW